jgi:hypothetical protein
MAPEAWNSGVMPAATALETLASLCMVFLPLLLQGDGHTLVAPFLSGDRFLLDAIASAIRMISVLLTSSG